ncbi:MAG: glycosyltransferase family 4 protein, partial [Terrimicrobiaceae bacterium]
MAVVCANEVSGASHRDEAKRSPLLHTAVHNLLDGLKDRTDIEVEVVYGRMHPKPGEDRWEGCLHYVPVHCKPLPIPGMGGAFLARTLALLRHIKKAKPDIVHGQGTERESGLVAALCGRPSVLTLHGNFRAIAKTIHAKPLSYFGIAAMIERFCLPRVSGVHCLSSHTKASVGTLAQHTWIIPNAVNQHFFEVVRAPASEPYIICVAGITEWKNPMLLVEAGDTLQKCFPQTEIHFIGTCDPEHTYAKAFLDAVAQRRWCYYHGQCSPDALILHMARATCSVLPSRQENFGLALAEALAAGIPVLGSKTGGIPDVVQDGKTG